jgi:MATE family multidrug resistance protein
MEFGGFLTEKGEMNREDDRLIDTSRNPGGYRDVLRVAFPLALSTSSWAILHFTDRMFLSRYSNEAVAAAMAGSVTNFGLVSLFMGTANYVNAFIAQYIGARKPHEVGRILWQGIYFSIFSGIVLLGGILLARPMFGLIGHGPKMMEMEVQYFRILCCGSGATVLGSTLSCFFIGRGKTLVVMCVNFTAASANVVLDYAWIFGNWGFPRLGIRGAGYATVVATTLRFLLCMVLVLRRTYRRRYGTARGWRPSLHLFRRLMRFGLPNGVQLMLEILGFSLFILLVGKLSSEALTASAIAFSINSLAFTPMLGFAFSVSTLVGQYLGANRPDIAARSANSAFRMSCLYVGGFCLVYLVAPGVLVQFFGSKENPEQFESIRKTVSVLLKFVAVYSLFDMLNIIYAHAIKGAGDTRFVMWVSAGLSWPILIIPSYLICWVFKGSVYLAWGFMTLYVMVLGVTFYLRFRGGKWKAMRVIEAGPRAPGPFPEVPASEPGFYPPGERDVAGESEDVSRPPDKGKFMEQEEVR